jgi:hypothetical protein
MLRLIATLTLLVQGCGLTVTNERPSYEDLDKPERDAVDIIYAELKALDTQVRSRTKAMFKKTYDLTPIVNKQNINVSFKGMMLAYNIGDGQVHVAAWENLTDKQRTAVQTAFKTTPANAAAWYRSMFYRVMAATQGIKQYCFNVNSVEKAYSSFSVFNMELHPIRTAMAYFRDVGRHDIWSFTATACTNVLSQGQSAWGHMFTTAQSNLSPRFPLAKAFMREHHDQFIHGEDPTVNLYFICQWTRISREEADPTVNLELEWLYTKLK